MNHSRIIRYLSGWIPVLLCMGLIFYLSSLSGDKAVISQNDWVERNLRKFPHMIEYAVLWVLQLRAYLMSGVERKSAVIATWVSAVLFAISDEYHQSFIPGREASWGDVMWDCLGMLAAYVILLRLRVKAIENMLAHWEVKG